MFDLDGTLGDTLPICFKAFRHAIFEFTGRLVSDQEIRATFGPSEDGIIKRHIPGRWQECLELYVERYRSEHSKSRDPFPGMHDLLRRLGERGIQCAVVTGKSIVTAEISLEAMGIRSYFDVVQGGAAEGDVKARNIISVLDGWSMPAPEAAYVGDAPSDVDAANKTGVAALAAVWSGNSDIDAIVNRRPAAIFRDVDEMIDFVERQS